MVVSRLDRDVIREAAEYVVLHMRDAIFTRRVALPEALPKVETFHEYKVLPRQKYVPSKPTAKEQEQYRLLQYIKALHAAGQSPRGVQALT